nr:hypothetical protein [Tanacetum cinerariifolium]
GCEVVTMVEVVLAVGDDSHGGGGDVVVRGGDGYGEEAMAMVWRRLRWRWCGICLGSRRR